jgi:enterobactin synthetase component D / holo-[acyl-carrier protein] synthase
VLEEILPPRVVTAEAFGDDQDAWLFPEEEAAIAAAVAGRRREFATARACARTALGRLGEPPAPILRGAKGAPCWPAGVTGSITHCEGYRAAAVARSADVLTLGLDAEPDEALPDGVLDVISLGAERAALAALAASAPGVCWDRLLFSAKESVYKAWFPLARRWLGFEEAEVCIDGAAGTFTATLLVPGPVVAGSPLRVLDGRWMTGRGLVLTAIVLPAR